MFYNDGNQLMFKTQQTKKWFKRFILIKNYLYNYLRIHYKFIL